MSSWASAWYQQYLKLTGATIDLDQFRELYGFRHRDSSIRIARAVDRWFDDPNNADESANKELIDRHRAGPSRGSRARSSSSASAWRTLSASCQTKPTKAAGQSRRIAGAALARLSRLKATQPHPDDARIFPMHHAPIVVQGGQPLLSFAAVTMTLRRRSRWQATTG